MTHLTGPEIAARTRSIIATLVDHFHLSTDRIGKLTDRQIAEIYWHPRDDKGQIQVPDLGAIGEVTGGEPTSLEGELLALNMLAGALRLPPDEIKKKSEELRERYGRQQSCR